MIAHTLVYVEIELAIRVCILYYLEITYDLYVFQFLS